MAMIEPALLSFWYKIKKIRQSTDYQVH